jgi:hypothetical protein
MIARIRPNGNGMNYVHIWSLPRLQEVFPVLRTIAGRVGRYSPSSRPKRGLFKVITGVPRSLDFSPADFRRAFPDKSLWESCSSETDEAVVRCRTGDSHGFRIAPLEPIHIHSDKRLHI